MCFGGGAGVGVRVSGGVWRQFGGVWELVTLVTHFCTSEHI